jgi:GAF domain-containing protein
MRTKLSQPVGSGGSGHAGGVTVPSDGSGPARASAEDLAQLTQAERAARALEQHRGAKEIPIDRAFLEAALDLRRTIRTLVAATVPRLADWCWVDLIGGDGTPRRVEVAHADPAQTALADEMRALSVGLGWATPAAQSMRDRAPRLFRVVTGEVMTWATHDERHLAVLRAMHPNSLLAVPLVARDRIIGALTLIRSTMLPPLDEEALLAAEELAAPAALALDNARRYEAERSARIAADEALARARPRER